MKNTHSFTKFMPLLQSRHILTASNKGECAGMGGVDDWVGGWVGEWYRGVVGTRWSDCRGTKTFTDTKTTREYHTSCKMPPKYPHAENTLEGKLQYGAQAEFLFLQTTCKKKKKITFNTYIFAVLRYVPC